MSSLDEVKNELKHKRKTVDDLIRFISTRNENEPNYSLLLGAGCSISSDIKSATALVSAWEKEIYESATGLTFDESKAEQFFATENWYDLKTRYSCLFEKRYDLPKQRRAFIEQEVDKKIPSIGYAYLVKLIEKAYFRTVFTTNFDDLLNQAFYSHSKERPIVCAHDSSINSVTVTSKRPKIIKLHGDYLFDDIKSSQRETESLEENIKSKFVEFTRDYGLIVVGYGGGDRSVMDVLNYLLRHDEYLGHGIYWCIRKGSEVNSDLKRLLWHDRVFFVEIDGFDELFAEVNAKIFKGQQLPYETRISSELDGLLLEIKNNKKTFSKCRYICEDLEKSEDILMKEVIGNAVKSVSESNGEEEYSTDENLILSKITDKTIKEKYEEALELIEPYLTKPKGDATPSWIVELYSAKAFSFKKIGKIEEAAATYRQAIDFMQEKKVTGLLSTFDRLIEITKKPDEKLSIISDALKADPYWSTAYLKKADQLAALYDHGLQKVGAKDVVDAFEMSLVLDPSIGSNKNGYRGLFDFVLNNKLLDEFKEQFAKALNSAKVQDPHSRLVVQTVVNLFILEKKSMKEISGYVEGVKGINRLPGRTMDYDISLLKGYEKRGELSELKSYLDKMDKLYAKNRTFTQIKSELLLRKFCDLDGAIEALETLPISGNDDSINLRLLRLYNFSSNLTKAKEIINKNIKNDKFNELAFNYYFATGDTQAAEASMQDVDEVYDATEYSVLTFQLLCLGRYQQAMDILRQINDATSFSHNVLVINYELARLLMHEKINVKRLSHIRDSSKSPIERAAASCVIYDERQQPHEREMRDKFINEALDEDYETLYSMKTFPVFGRADLDNFQRKKIPVFEETANLSLDQNEEQSKAA